MKITGLYSAPTRLILAGALFAMMACSHPGSEKESEYIVTLGSSHLSLEDVRVTMPGGLSADDSVKYVKAYVSAWIDERLAMEVASDDIDMDEINRLTEEYRRQLIMAEYKRRMFDAQAAEIPEDTLKAFYTDYGSRMTLDRPMVRGVYIKLPEKASNIAVIRKLYRSAKRDDQDQLEKEVLKAGAVHYDYFRDRWIDWEQIETRVPHDFGASSASWTHAGSNLDETYNGYVYLLQISEVLPAGTPLPYEAAKSLIAARLLNGARRKSDAALQHDLRQKAIDDGKLVIAPTLQ